MGIQGHEKADIEAKKYADTRIRADTKFSLCLKSYSPKWLKEWETKGASQAVKYGYQELKI